MIVIISHASFNDERKPILGTGAFFSPYFSKKNKNFFYLRFPMHGESYYQIEKTEASQIKYEIVDHSFSKNLLLKSLQELIVVYKELSKLKNLNLVISIDPLNTLYSLILKKLLKIKRVIFYTADYAISRFENRILNKIYHLIDLFSLNHADFVWNVSTRITAHRKSQGLSDAKNFFVPNSPIFDKNKILNIEKIERHSLVIVTTLVNSLDFDSIFASIAELKKEYKNIKLTIIGRGNWEEYFSKLLKKYQIQDNVIFHGPMSHDKLVEKIKISAIGVALYTNDNPWTYFCDSMKARDYLSCGLPVIISTITSTSDDIVSYQAGFSIDNNFKDNMIKGISKLFSSDQLYKKYRQNAIKLAKSYDIENILDKTFESCKIKI